MLATRASAGGVSLWQARGPDACLCIGSGDCEPAGSHSKLDIQAGYFKYGWYAEPQRFITPVPESTTNAAASAAQKAMQGISMTPKPVMSDMKRYSSSSGADMSSQSTDFMYRSSSMTASAPIAIGSKDSSNDDSLVSSMYTDTVMDGSVTSDATSKTNKTRRGKRGGKKQRENSQIRRMQSVPQSVSPMMVRTHVHCYSAHSSLLCSQLCAVYGFKSRFLHRLGGISHSGNRYTNTCMTQSWLCHFLPCNCTRLCSCSNSV